MRTLSKLALCLFLLTTSITSLAQRSDYAVGRISNVTFVNDYILFMLNSGLPGNCAGSSFGWMMISASAKPMAAFVIGLRLSGEMANVQVEVYTSGLNSLGYCEVEQIDPVN